MPVMEAEPITMKTADSVDDSLDKGLVTVSLDADALLPAVETRTDEFVQMVVPRGESISEVTELGEKNDFGSVNSDGLEFTQSQVVSSAAFALDFSNIPKCAKRGKGGRDPRRTTNTKVRKKKQLERRKKIARSQFGLGAGTKITFVSTEYGTEVYVGGVRIGYLD